MRLAAVDVGSNTVHVLVADAKGSRLTDVAHYVEMPELGQAVAKSGAVGSHSKVAIEALKKVIEQARRDGFEHLVAGATAAVRNASDRKEFAAAAGIAIGVPVHILSEQREAELTFAGAASRHAGRREWLLADLGGGSTELVIGRELEMVRWATLEMGSGVLAARFLADPPTPDQRAKLRQAALRLLRGAPDGEVERIVATGGTASNLPHVLARQNPPSVLTTADLLRCEERLDGRAASELHGELGLPVARIKALRAGVEVLLLLLDWYGQSTLQVSHEGLRHGMLLAYLERGDKWWK